MDGLSKAVAGILDLLAEALARFIDTPVISCIKGCGFGLGSAHKNAIFDGFHYCYRPAFTLAEAKVLGEGELGVGAYELEDQPQTSA